MEGPMVPQPSPEEIDQEVSIAKEAVGRSLPHFLKSVELISESYLAHALIALWDSGLYEYMRQRGRVEIQATAGELGLDPEILRSLMEYLLGRGLLEIDGPAFVLSAKGRAYWNYVTRGALTSHLGGYTALLTHLGPLLRREIALDDPRLERSERLVGSGARCTLLGSDMAPWLLETIRRLNCRCVLDLGCGNGTLLTRLALKWPEGRGVGIDANGAGVEQARSQAEAHGLADRLTFHQAVLSAEPMNLDDTILAPVDVVTAIFFIHEFSGQGGDPAIAAILASLRKQLPGRKLLLVEGSRADPYERKSTPVRSYAQLDYTFIHPLSGQGPLRTPNEWQRIIEGTGARLLETIPGFKLIPSWVNQYIVQL
jgi:SAM-dependent methyltransferase